MKTTINQRGEYARGCAPNILCIISRHYLPATALSCTHEPPTPTLVRGPAGLCLRRGVHRIASRGPWRMSANDTRPWLAISSLMDLSSFIPMLCEQSQRNNLCLVILIEMQFHVISNSYYTSPINILRKSL